MAAQGEAKSLQGLLRTQLEVASLAERKELADSAQLRRVYLASFSVAVPDLRNSLFFALQKLLAS